MGCYYPFSFLQVAPFSLQLSTILSSRLHPSLRRDHPRTFILMSLIAMSNPLPSFGFTHPAERNTTVRSSPCPFFVTLTPTSKRFQLLRLFTFAVNRCSLFLKKLIIFFNRTQTQKNCAQAIFAILTTRQTHSTML